MLDSNLFRKQPQWVAEAFARRGLADPIPEFARLDQERSRVQSATEELEAQRNRLAKAVARAKASGEDAAALLAEAAPIGAQLDALGSRRELAQEALRAYLERLPNFAAEDTPPGASDTDNQLIAQGGSARQFDFEPLDHADLGERFGGLALDLGAKLAGSRFAVLGGQLARLERALGQFMLDTHVARGYREVSTPALVAPEILRGTGQLPKFADDLFRLERDDLYLIPTAEVTLTNLLAGEIVDEAALPIKLTALTPCFRREAGSAGRDTRGLIRQHQFQKVELVRFETAERSERALEELVEDATRVLRELDLPWRAMRLCGGDLGFGAQKTVDLEVWLPSQKTYREISSCSNCGDFQARRAQIRSRAAGGKPRLLHTLNGSGLAVGRALVAVLENRQNADLSVEVPPVLRPYMGGLETLRPERDWREPAPAAPSSKKPAL
jgi:seryl-tRNA synthetase